MLSVGNDAVAVTGRSASVARSKLELAERIAREIGIRHFVIDTDEFEDLHYVQNDGTRCYYCKSELYDKVDRLRAEIGF